MPTRTAATLKRSTVLARLACAGVDYIFLGCIGYTAHHATLAAASGVETRTARGLAVRGAVDWLNAMP